MHALFTSHWFCPALFVAGSLPSPTFTAPFPNGGASNEVDVPISVTSTLFSGTGSQGPPQDCAGVVAHIDSGCPASDCPARHRRLLARSVAFGFQSSRR